jgi:TolB protein
MFLCLFFGLYNSCHNANAILIASIIAILRRKEVQMKTYNTSVSNKLSALLCIGYFLSVLTPTSTALAAPPTIIRASVSSAGVEGNSSSLAPALSANGRFIVFYSSASNLVTGGSVGEDIYVRDLKSGVTRRVSVDSDGVSGNGSSFDPTISSNGRFVAFWSNASNLVTEDNNEVEDVFVHDLKIGVTQRVSLSSSGGEGNGGSQGPALSANGRYVAFGSGASNLVAGDANDVYDVFVRDLETGVTQRVSLDSTGAEGNGQSDAPTLSADGRYIVFLSIATNLVTNDSNGLQDVFIRDLENGVTQRVSLSSAGVEGDDLSYGPAALSANGRYVAFASDASNLVIDDTNGTRDIFVRDLKIGVTRRVSLDSAGAQGNNGSFAPTISANGHLVAFYSSASNLVADDTNSTEDVFVRNLKSGLTKRLSLDSAGNEGNNFSAYPAISANGHFVAFESGASNLVTGDNNDAVDVFVRRR